jgi:hypothetical protein
MNDPLSFLILSVHPDRARRASHIISSSEAASHKEGHQMATTGDES